MLPCRQHQCVSIDGFVSDLKRVVFGVPYGSVLGPTLFQIYLNDLCKLVLSNCKIITYAENTALLVHGETWSKIALYAQSALSTIIMRLTRNLLTFVPKYNSLPPGVTLMAHSDFCAQNPKWPCMQITNLTKAKYLGIWIDSHLSGNVNYALTRA